MLFKCVLLRAIAVPRSSCHPLPLLSFYCFAMFPHHFFFSINTFFLLLSTHSVYCFSFLWSASWNNYAFRLSFGTYKINWSLAKIDGINDGAAIRDENSILLRRTTWLVCTANFEFGSIQKPKCRFKFHKILREFFCVISDH